MTSSRWWSLALAASVACAGPATSGSEEGDASPRPTDARQTIRLEIPEAPDVADIPRLMARDALQRAGYIVESQEFRDTATTVQAVLEGKLDIADVPFTQILAGVQRGAPISAIVSRGGRVRVLVGAPEIRTCADLNNQQVSSPTFNSTQALTLRRYIDTRCPGTKIDMVVISRVENRMTAMLTQKTGAALLDLASMVKLQQESGGTFHILSVFGVDFPDFIEGTAVASRAFLDAYPDAARDFVRETITATRAIQDPDVMKGEIEKRLGVASDQAALLAKTYLENNVWDLNGGLSPYGIQTTIDFSVESGMIEPGLTVEESADVSYLNAVLAEIGRR